LEAVLEASAEIAYLQESLVGKHDISYLGFLFYWPEGLREYTHIMTTVRQDIVVNMVIKARTDLVNHPYFIAIDIVERGRRTRVVNCYDSWLGVSYTYVGASQHNWRALIDIN
jgi:hypothetical protein